MGRLIRLTEVVAQTGMSKPSVYRQLQAGTFPRPVKLGPRAVAWRQEDIENWIQSRPVQE